MILHCILNFLHNHDLDMPMIVTLLGHKLFLSNSGEQGLLVCSLHKIYLWELNGIGSPVWWRLTPPVGVALPQSSYREASIDACFFVHSVSQTHLVCMMAM